MLLLLTAAGAFVYWRVEYALDRGLDTELEQATDTITPLIGSDGTATVPEAANATGAGWQVLDDSGNVLDSGGPAPRTAMVTTSQLAKVGDGTRTIDIGSFLPVSDKTYRIQLTGLQDGRAAYLLVGVRRDHRDEALRELLVQLTVAGLGALAIAAIVGDLLARAALRPVERYRRRAAEIAGGADGLRLDVPAGRDDEVTRLGHTLNDMLAALEESLHRERRFVDDASHELRTPLTLLKSRIQLARRRSRSAQDYERVLDELAIDVSRMADLAEQLLALGPASLTTDGTSDVSKVVNALVERRRLARPEQAHQVTVEVPTATAIAAIDPHALERVVSNLVENAFAHGQPPVQVRVWTTPQHVAIQVTDAGPGMPQEMLAQATGRFTRAPDARARPGAGLGLALVEQLVTAAGGELRLCYAGHHVSRGTATALACDHGDAMTMTVLIPVVDTHR
jgi:signal transduction histidine kinase